MTPPEKARAEPERAAVTLEEPPRRGLSMRGMLGDAFGSVTDLVTRPMRTVGSLLKRPGQLIRSYVEGNRARIAGPGRIAFLGVSLFLVVNSLVATGMAKMFDPFIWWKGFWPYIAPLLLLPASAVQRLLFRKRRFSFGDTYAFGLYMLGTIAAFHAVLLTINYFTGLGDVHSSTTEYVRNGIIMLIEAVYVAWAATGFYDDRKPGVWLRGALSYGAFVGISFGILYAVFSYIIGGIF
ncbi:MAG TPA: DUF3667 domain-containing protein [Longimicrobiales bacterium]